MHNISDDKLVNAVHHHINMPSTGWSLGAFGAVAEFNRTEDENCQINLSATGGEVITDKGGLRVDFKRPVNPAPYQMLRRDRLRWLHGLNFCSPDGLSVINKNIGVIEMGSDENALRDQDKSAVLFDLGLAIPHIKCCVRSHDPDIIHFLNNKSGHSIFGANGRVMNELVKCSPHRVFISRFGRIEVFQAIPEGEDEKTPSGPHSHITETLLKQDRQLSANVSVPNGHRVLLSMYPKNPVADFSGAPEPFDIVAFQEFQKLIKDFASTNDKKLIDKVINDVRSGYSPWKTGLTRSQRTLLRVVLRQLFWLDQPNDSVVKWQSVFEPMIKKNYNLKMD